uniref:Si:dkey-106n21.1 n=1 Tax=Hucho hucho TaxID=62062 RepID=A0A4W5NH56_9TELE
MSFNSGSCSMRQPVESCGLLLPDIPIQGAILVSSLLQLVLGLSGLVGLVLKFIGPLAIAPTINLIGLSLFIEAGKKSGAHWGIAAM